GRVVLAVLRGDARCSTVRTAENNLTPHLPAGHVERFSRGVDELINCLHGKIESHELDNRLQAGKPGADAKAGKAMLCNGSIDHSVGAELLQETLRDFVCALIFG